MDIELGGRSPSSLSQHGWVLSAARLKRIYLRLLSHFSFALARDPSRLPVPDCNLIARRGAGWEAHWLRLAALLFYALGEAEGGAAWRRAVQARPELAAWMEGIAARLQQGGATIISANWRRPERAVQTNEHVSDNKAQKMASNAKEAEEKALALKTGAALEPRLERAVASEKNGHFHLHHVASNENEESKDKTLTGNSLPLERNVAFKGSPSELAAHDKPEQPLYPSLSPLTRREDAPMINELPIIQREEKREDAHQHDRPDRLVNKAQSEPLLPLHDFQSTECRKASSASDSGNGNGHKLPTPTSGHAEALAASSQDLRDRISSLQDELARAQAAPSSDMSNIEEIAVLEIELDGTRAKLHQATERAQHLQRVLNEQAERCEALDQANVELRQELVLRDSLLARIEEEQNRHTVPATTADTPSRLQAELEAEKQKAQVHADNVMALERMIEGMDSDLSMTQQQLRTAHDRIRALEQQLTERPLMEALEKDLVQKIDTIKALESELAGKDQMLSALEESLAYEREKAENEREAAARQFAQLEAALECEQTQREAANLRSHSLEDLMEALGAEQSKVTELQETLQERESRISKLEEALSTHRNDAIQMQERMASLEQREHYLQADHEGQLKRLEAECQKKISKLNEERAAQIADDSKHLEEVNALSKTIEHLELRLKESDQEHKEQLEDLRQAGEETAAILAEDVEQLRSHLASVTSVKDEMNLRLVALQEALEAKENLIAKLTAEATDSTSSLSDQLSEKDDQIYKLESELALLAQSKAAIEQLERSLGAKDRRIVELERALAGLEEDLAETNLQITAFNDTITKLGSERDQLIKKLELAQGTHHNEQETIAELKEKLASNSVHLEQLASLQARIEQFCAAFESDKLPALEQSVVQTIVESKESIHSMATMNAEKLNGLTKLQTRIDEGHQSLDAAKVTPLEEGIRKLETLLVSTQQSLEQVKTRKHTKTIKLTAQSEEQQMILAAWHDLGLKIMKLKAIEK